MTKEEIDSAFKRISHLIDAKDNCEMYFSKSIKTNSRFNEYTEKFEDEYDIKIQMRQQLIDDLNIAIRCMKDQARERYDKRTLI